MYDAAIEASIKTHILIIIPFFFHAADPKKETTTSITLSIIIITLVGYTIILHFYLRLLLSKIFRIRFPMRWDFPFWFDSFDKDYDNRLGHHYLTAWQSIQGVNKDKDPDPVNTLLKLLPPASTVGT